MDPITLILTALVTGAAKAAGDAVPDAYKGLKALIQKKFAGKPEAEMVLAKHEEKAKVWEEPLKDALVEAGVDKDEAVIKEAQELMNALDPQGTATGAYTVSVAGNVYGVAGENKGTVNQIRLLRMSNNKPHNPSSTSFYDEDDERQLSPRKMRDILAQIKEILYDSDNRFQLSEIFFENLAGKIENWYAELSINVNKEDESLKRQTLEMRLPTLSLKVIRVVLDLISQDINSLDKDCGLEDFEKNKERIRSKFLKEVLEYKDIYERYRIDNFLSELRNSIYSVTNSHLDPSVLEGQEDVEITALIRQYFDELISIVSSISPLISDEEEQSGSSDQNSGEQVVKEGSLMELPDEEFLREVKKLQRRMLNSPSDYYLSMEEFDQILYEFNQAKLRGEQMNTFQQKQAFMKEQWAVLNRSSDPIYYLTEKQRERYRSLMFDRARARARVRIVEKNGY